MIEIISWDEQLSAIKSGSDKPILDRHSVIAWIESGLLTLKNYKKNCKNAIVCVEGNKSGVKYSAIKTELFGVIMFVIPDKNKGVILKSLKRVYAESEKDIEIVKIV